MTTFLIVQNGRWSVHAQDDDQAIDLLALTALVIHAQDPNSWAGGRIVETLALLPENKDLLTSVHRWLERLTDLSSTAPRLMVGYDSDGDLGLWYLTEESAHGFRQPYEPLRCLCVSQRRLKNPRLWFLPPQKLERLEVSVTKYRCDLACPPLDLERSFWLDRTFFLNEARSPDEITSRPSLPNEGWLLHSDPTLHCAIERVKLCHRDGSDSTSSLKIVSPCPALVRRLRHQPLCTLLFGPDPVPDKDSCWNRAIATRVSETLVELRPAT